VENLKRGRLAGATDFSKKKFCKGGTSKGKGPKGPPKPGPPGPLDVQLLGECRTRRLAKPKHRALKERERGGDEEKPGEGSRTRG